MRCAALCLLLFWALASWSCSPGSELGFPSSEESSVFHVSADDLEMNRAMDESRAHIAEFIERLEHPPATQSRALLKVRVDDGVDVEHLWLEDVEHAAGVFRGTVADQPLSTRQVKLGERLEIPIARISDWLTIDGGKLVGGRTVRLLRQRMSASERAALDADSEFVIE